MEDCELEELINDRESDRVERKESITERERIRQAICAFANDLPNHNLPGVVFVGLTDDGQCAGLEITEQLLLTLSDMRSDGNILPIPSMVVQRKNLNGCELAVVVVHPSDAPPVRYKGQVYIRVGPRRAIASPDEERRLVEKRRARDLPFDLRPFPSASIADLDLDLFLRSYLPSEQGLEVIEQNRRTTEQQLASVRFVTPPPEFIPTALGLLMVGKRPRDFLAGHYVQFLRIDGTELTDPAKDEKELDGPIVELLRVLEEVLRAHIAVAVDYASASLEIKTPDYPVRALEQIVRNAIMHRTYESSHAPVRILWFSDRIEVHNPGGPYGQVTVEHFGEPGRTDYRNPHLSACLKSLGYVQKFGVGIQLAREELEKNGNLPLEFQVDPAHICAVLRRRT